jgi:stalled ribosome alternative rescue factor ArfA
MIEKRRKNRGQACDFAILELLDHSTIQRWRVTENRKSKA